MPVYVLALTDPSFYLAAIMKTVTLGQQSGENDTRTAGRELVGSTLSGAALSLSVWIGLSLWPSLKILVLWLMAAALWVGSALFGVRRTQFRPSLLEQCADSGSDPTRSGHRGQCQRQERPGGRRHTNLPLCKHRFLCLGHGGCSNAGRPQG